MADNKMDYRDDDIDFDMTEAQKVEDRRSNVSPDSHQDDFYEELSSADDQSHKKNSDLEMDSTIDEDDKNRPVI